MHTIKSAKAVITSTSSLIIMLKLRQLSIETYLYHFFGQFRIMTRLFQTSSAKLAYNYSVHMYIRCRIAGNFVGENFRGLVGKERKRARNVKTGCIMGVACLQFRGENFHGWLKNCEIFSFESFPLYGIIIL